MERYNSWSASVPDNLCPDKAILRKSPAKASVMFRAATCAQRQPRAQQGVVHFTSAQHNMQLRQRRARQKRHIFRGFRPGSGDPGRHLR